MTLRLAFQEEARKILAKIYPFKLCVDFRSKGTWSLLGTKHKDANLWLTHAKQMADDLAFDGIYYIDGTSTKNNRSSVEFFFRYEADYLRFSLLCFGDRKLKTVREVASPGPDESQEKEAYIRHCLEINGIVAAIHRKDDINFSVTTSTRRDALRVLTYAQSALLEKLPVPLIHITAPRKQSDDSQSFAQLLAEQGITISR